MSDEAKDGSVIGTTRPWIALSDRRGTGLRSIDADAKALRLCTPTPEAVSWIRGRIRAWRINWQ